MERRSLNAQKKILFLYSEVMGYTVSTIKALLEAGCEVHVIHWDKKKLTPYEAPDMEHLNLYPRSSFTSKSLAEFIDDLDPDLAYVSGWQDKGYLPHVFRLRRKGIPVVSGFDGQWQHGVKYLSAKLLASIRFFKLFFSHAWVAGARQYEFARNLGFKHEEIISDLYAADLSIFAGDNSRKSLSNQMPYPHRFLFVGRLEQVKGIQVLLDAWVSLGDKCSDWELWIVGNGSLESSLELPQGVSRFSFKQPKELATLVADAGVFVLPSDYEPWGVVVHEFAAAGLPLVLSSAVGAANSFLIPGLNGFSFRAGDSLALKGALEKIIELSDDELHAFSAASSSLSQRITPQTSAANLLSLTFTL